MHRPATLSLPSLLLMLAVIATDADAAPAQKKTIWYRCTSANGVVSLQNGTPCPAGSKQEKRSVEAVPSLPPPPAAGLPLHLPARRTPAAPPTAPPTPASTPPADAPPPTPAPLPKAATPVAERLPPPPLFECRSYDDDRYLSDDPAPKQRCAPMQTIGIDGSAALGAGAACSMQTDHCQRVPDGAACDAWRKWLNQAQAAWTFARADRRAQAKSEYERLARIVAETTCNQAP